MSESGDILQARETGDRRRQNRRAPQRPLDTLFAATLVNQIAPAEMSYVRGYGPPRGPRAGIAINIRA